MTRLLTTKQGSRHLNPPSHVLIPPPTGRPNSPSHKSRLQREPAIAPIYLEKKGLFIFKRLTLGSRHDENSYASLSHIQDKNHTLFSFLSGGKPTRKAHFYNRRDYHRQKAEKECTWRGKARASESASVGCCDNTTQPAVLRETGYKGQTIL